jgi:lysyl-tRNA synthetase class 1
MEKRVYELSQVGDVPKTPGYQIPFRHLCNLLQINSGDIDAVIASLPDVLDDQVERLRTRCRCAWAWITTFAPEDFRFSVATAETPKAELDEGGLKAVRCLCAKVATWDGKDEKALSQLIYDAAAEAGVENAALFTATYLALIGKEKGPKLAGFMGTLGKDRVVGILSRY